MFCDFLPVHSLWYSNGCHAWISNSLREDTKNCKTWIDMRLKDEVTIIDLQPAIPLALGIIDDKDAEADQEK